MSKRIINTIKTKRRILEQKLLIVFEFHDFSMNDGCGFQNFQIEIFACVTCRTFDPFDG